MTQTIVFYSLFLHSHRFIQFFIKEKSDLTSISQMLQKKHRWFAVSTLSIFFFQICIHTSRNIVARKSLNIWIFLDALLFLKIRELVENRKFLKIRLFWLIQFFIIFFNWRNLFVNRWCWNSWWKIVVFWIEKKNSYEWINVNDEFSIIEFLIIVEIVLLIERTNKYIEIFIWNSNVFVVERISNWLFNVIKKLRDRVNVYTIDVIIECSLIEQFWLRCLNKQYLQTSSSTSIKRLHRKNKLKNFLFSTIALHFVQSSTIFRSLIFKNCQLI